MAKINLLIWPNMNLYAMYKTLCIFSFALMTAFTSVGQDIAISGKLIEHNTQEALAYVQIIIKGTSLGCLTNLDGEFELDIPRKHLKDTLFISFLGYRQQNIPISELNNNENLKIELQTEAYGLDEVVVTPHPALYYIKQSMKDLPKYYVTQTHNSTIFSREIVKINGKFYSLNEAVLKGNFVPFVKGSTDTSRIQVLAYRRYFNKEVGAVLIDEKKSDKRVKKAHKKNKKKEKKGEETEEVKSDEESMYEAFRSIFAGLSVFNLWDSTLVRSWHLDSSGYEDIRFTQGRMLHEGEKKIMEIRMYDKKKEEKSPTTGSILLNYDDLAFRQAKIGLTPRGFGWGAAKTALRLFGIKVNYLNLDVIYRYEEINSKYAPANTTLSILAGFEKIHWFSDNEVFNIEVNTNNLVLDSEYPSKDNCIGGKQLLKGKHISEQFDENFGDEVWNKYKSVLKTESVFK